MTFRPLRYSVKKIELKYLQNRWTSPNYRKLNNMFFRDNYAIKFASSFIVYPLNISLITYGVSQVVNFFRPFTI